MGKCTCQWQDNSLYRDTDEHGWTQINHYSRQAAKLAKKGMSPFLNHLIPEKGTFASAPGRGKPAVRQERRKHIVLKQSREDANNYIKRPVSIYDSAEFRN